MLFFALEGSHDLGRHIAQSGGFAVSPHEERDFSGGEHKSRPLVSVRGHDVYVLHGLHGRPGQSANDKFCRLLFFIAACKENGADRVTAIIPYLAYSRKDRQTKSRDPVTTKYVAQLLEAVGVHRVITLDVHTPIAFQNAFRCETVHLDSRGLFAADLAKTLGTGSHVVLSPDGGGVKRAELLREHLEASCGKTIGFGFMEKRRSQGVVSGHLFAGDVDGCIVHIVDDMISSGGTIIRAARACRERGATAVYALATHGLFFDDASSVLADEALDGIAVTDSAGPFPADLLGDRLRVISTAPLFAETIRRLHYGGSVGDLLEPTRD